MYATRGSRGEEKPTTGGLPPRQIAHGSGEPPMIPVGPLCAQGFHASTNAEAAFAVVPETVS